jgi:WD40 repeat protein
MMVFIPEMVFSPGEAVAQDTYPAPKAQSANLRPDPSAWVFALTLSPNNRWLVTGSINGTACLWDVESGRPVRIFRGHTAWNDSGKSLLGTWKISAPGWVTCVAISPDGKMLATGSFDKTARLWDLATGKEIRVFPHSDGVQCLALSQDGKWLVTGCSDNTARLWDLATAKEIRAFRGHTDAVLSVALSNDGKRLATGSTDGTARLWDLETAKAIYSFRPGNSTGTLRRVLRAAFRNSEDVISSIALSRDGKWLVAGSDDHTAHLWDLDRGEEVRVFRGHTDRVCTVALTSDGKQIITGSLDHTARLWELATGKEIRVFKTSHGGERLTISPDDKWLVIAEDGGAQLWDLATGSPIRNFPSNSSTGDSGKNH